jgi:hypothetical protein
MLNIVALERISVIFLYGLEIKFFQPSKDWEIT